MNTLVVLEALTVDYESTVIQTISKCFFFLFLEYIRIIFGVILSSKRSNETITDNFIESSIIYLLKVIRIYHCRFFFFFFFSRSYNS